MRSLIKSRKRECRGLQAPHPGVAKGSASILLEGLNSIQSNQALHLQIHVSSVTRQYLAVSKCWLLLFSKALLIVFFFFFLPSFQ